MYMKLIFTKGIVPMPSQGGFFLMGRLPKCLSEQSVKGIPLQCIYSNKLKVCITLRYMQESLMIGLSVSGQLWSMGYVILLITQTGCFALHSMCLFIVVLNMKVVGVPASPFYSSSAYLQEPGAAPLARFAFCKQDTTLVEACRRLRMKSYIP